MTPTHRRDRYQRGSLTIEHRRSSPDVWIYRWREPAPAGRPVQRKYTIGTKKDYPTESAAWKAVEALRLDINAERVATAALTIRELAEHYKEKELGEGCTKTAKTRETYVQHIDHYIVSRWGGERIANIKAVRVEDWLKLLRKADGTKSKTKAVFSVLYQHAMRYGWAERNPIKEVRQSAKPIQEPDVLTPEEVTALFSRLPGYARYMVIVAAVTGLRRGELVGLRWDDIDFENGKLYVRRSLVDQVVGDPKTKGSKRPLPLEKALIFALGEWKQKTSYSQSSDWVFASPHCAGKAPYWPSTVLDKQIRPAALEAGIEKRIGWHTFRRTIATLLLANGESVKTTQDLMRHATPSMTLGTYAQAVTEDKRMAQNRIASLLGLETGEESLQYARSVPFCD